MRLAEPTLDQLEPFFRLAEEVRSAEADFASIATVQREHWDAYVERLRGMSDGSVQTKAGVPLSTFWWVDDAGEILAVSGLRHGLTDALRAYGGHIGFAVRPTARRQGHGVALLRATLARASAIGIDRALLTCDSSNVASRMVIERCGGALDAEYLSNASGVMVRRYWIAPPPWP